MTKYATFGPDGILNGRYDSNIHTVIPAQALPLTEQQFTYSIEHTNGYLQWVNGQIVWTVPPPPPLPSQAELFQLTVKQFDSAVEAHLYAEAASCGYTNIERACMYASSPNPYQAESQSFVEWVGNVWAYCYGELQKVEAGTRSMPSVEQIISELPTRVVP